ncbi:uncharacterized protein LOC142973321 [Anticarsia gemmatalis]|uniref:uncharacterized protein LOC142973321 n=1 Tax=Anticarsia gemmatalis TaxID=129554 RepID=UPI003F75E7BE
MSINWSNTQVFKLIDMFQEREFLWNPMLPEYRDRWKKYGAWCEMANEFGLDKHIVERKMRSLIGQFQRELKKSRSCASDDDTSGSNWFAYKKMMFIRDRCRRGQGVDTDYETRSEDNEKEESEDAKLRENHDKDTEYPEVEFHHIKETEFVTPSIQQHNSMRKRPRPRDEKDPSIETLSVLDNMYESQHQRDEFDVFAELVAMKLRKLRNTCAKNTAQFHINNILYNADMGDYDWPSNSDRWRHRSPGAQPSSRSSYDAPHSRRHNNRGPALISESSNDGSVTTVDDIIKCEVLDQP